MGKPFLIMGLRGRNGSDAPIAVPDDQCVDAVNVDFSEGGLVRRRGGSLYLSTTFSSGGPFADGIGSLIRHVPGVDETAMELWGADGSGQMGRLAGAVTWVEVTLADAMASAITNWNVFGVSLGGFLFLAYDTAQNRMHVWDGSTVRRAGFATPAVPTLATLGGAGLTFTRYYRVRWVHISGSDTVRRSEASPIASLAITDDSGIRVTQPAVAGEGETHWEIEYADAEAGPFYVAGQVAIATTTFDDTDATVDTTNDLSPEDGINTPQPSFKYIVKAGARLLQAGAYESSAGSSFVPLNNEVYWTPVLGANDVGDLERQPIAYRVSLEHPVSGLSDALNGIHYAFGQRAYSALVPTPLPGEGAFQRFTENTAIGCIRHQTIVSAEDEFGRPAIYFLSHRGPYRIGAAGLQYCGEDIEDIWATVNLSALIVAHGVYYADIHQVWWWVAEQDAITSHPTRRIVFDTRLGKSAGASVRGGWSTADGDAVAAYSSCLFSSEVAATMGQRLVPYTNPAGTSLITRWDIGTDDNGTDFEAYIDTKEYAPAGLGRNCSITEPHIIGEASATALVAVTARTDFGRVTGDPHLVSLAPEQSETHVQRKIEGMQVSGVGTVRFRIGDDGTSDPGFGTLDAFVATYEAAEGR